MARRRALHARGRPRRAGRRARPPRSPDQLLQGPGRARRAGAGPGRRGCRRRNGRCAGVGQRLERIGRDGQIYFERSPQQRPDRADSQAREEARRSRSRAGVRVVAAARSCHRDPSADYPGPSRGVAATRPRTVQVPSRGVAATRPRTVQVPAAASPRPVHGLQVRGVAAPRAVQFPPTSSPRPGHGLSRSPPRRRRDPSTDVHPSTD